MNYDENGFGTQDFTEPNSPSIIEPTGLGMGWIIVPFVAVLLWIAGSLLYGAYIDAPDDQQRHELHTNPLKEDVPPSPEICALPDDLCQPGAGPAKPVTPMEEPPVPFVEIPPPTSVPQPPATFPPEDPPEDLETWPPDVLAA